MSAPRHHESDTAFMRVQRGFGHKMRQTYAGGKRHAVSITVATVLASGIGEVKDLWVKHWDDQTQDKRLFLVGQKLKQVDDHLAATDSRVTKLETDGAYQRGLQDAKGHR